MEAIELRDYQVEVRNKVVDLYKQNTHGKAKFVWATGLGKTVGFSAIAHEIRKYADTNVLIIAHRDELLTQAAQKYHFIDPTAIIGKVGNGSFEWGAPVTVASIQTIARANHLKQAQMFNYGLVIVDECHHAHAENEYGKVLRALPNAFVIGCTATDDRLDKKTNDDLFGEAVHSMSILDAIDQGYLTNIRAIAVKTGTNLDGLHTKDGDYQVKELAEKIDTPARNQKIVDAYLEHASQLQAICFSVDIAHATHLAETFNSAGVSSVAVSGKTHNRSEILRDFEKGKYRVLCNCQVFTEGYDAETVYDEEEEKYIFLSCAIMARPTKSRGLYVQCVGRILRPAPTKSEALILDATDNILNHRLEPQNLAKIVGIDDLKDNETVKEAKARKAEELRKKRERKTTINREQDINLNVLVRLNWQRKDDGMFVLEVGAEKHRIALVPDWDSDYDETYGNYTVWARLAPFYDAQMWVESAPLSWAQGLAEKKARLLLSDAKNIKLVDRNAPWRNYPATDKQLEMLERFGVEVSPAITKGEASDIIDPIIEKLKAKKAKKEKIS